MSMIALVSLSQSKIVGKQVQVVREQSRPAWRLREDERFLTGAVSVRNPLMGMVEKDLGACFAEGEPCLFMVQSKRPVGVDGT